MSKRIALGLLLAVVASAITASAVVVVGQQGEGPPEETYIPPEKALKPSELTKIPSGTPVADLALPVDYGPFRILPPGSVPEPCYDPLPPGVKTSRVDVKESGTLEEFRDHDLFFEPPYIPAGWELTEAHAETAVFDDGSQVDSLFGLEYQRPEYFYIRIARWLTSADCRIERVADTPPLQHAYTLGEIRGVPVLFQHQAPGQQFQALLQVHFVTHNAVTFIESVAIDFDELIKIADAMIAQSEEGSS